MSNVLQHKILKASAGKREEGETHDCNVTVASSFSELPYSP